MKHILQENDIILFLSDYSVRKYSYIRKLCAPVTTTDNDHQLWSKKFGSYLILKSGHNR